MGIMAAGMHQAVMFGRPWQIGLFRHRQSIHIGAQANGLSRRRSFKHAHNPGYSNAAVNRYPHCFEVFGNDLGGSVFLQPDFRMGMQVTAA